MLGVCPAPRDSGRFVDLVHPGQALCAEGQGAAWGRFAYWEPPLALYHPLLSNDRRNEQEGSVRTEPGERP